MRWSFVFRTLGALIFCLGITLLLPIGFSLYYSDDSLKALIKSMGIILALGIVLFTVFRGKDDKGISHREGMAIVTLAWLGAGAVGALPYYLSGTCAHFVDAFFESLSGFTTTGASILTDIEAVPFGVLMWRSLTHWLGGMGIIVFSLAVLPFLGVGGMQLYRAEVPGPVPDKLRPRIRDTAILLWKVYLFFTIAQTILLLLGGLSFFDALSHAFSTIATGGFSTKNASIGHFDSAYVQWVVIMFMLIAGINFALHYAALTGKPLVMLGNAEFRFFTATMLVFVAVTTASLLTVLDSGMEKVFRDAAFQVVSIITTTGYATADYQKWPPLPQAILVFCMFLGGCAGSTSGGMKCMRILLLLKQAYLELVRLIHPKAILQVKLGRRIVPDEVIKSIWGYFIIYLGLFILASFIVAAMGVDVVTSFSGVAACIGNIGPGLGEVGPVGNYAHLPEAVKWVLSFCMVLGRLEIYTVVVLLVPEFWRK